MAQLKTRLAQLNKVRASFTKALNSLKGGKERI